MTEHYYGEAPVAVGEFDLSADWQEFMHYLYLPVRIPFADSEQPPLFRLPERLAFAQPLVVAALQDAREEVPDLTDPYVYITARRGFATPGNPLNRPGWHCDDFGGSDLNYTWCDRYPTRYLSAPDGLTIPTDDAASMETFEALAWQAENTFAPSIHVEEVPLNTLMRLSPYVVHDTPIIPEPGGMRSFLKVSISSHRYDLIGNSHNYLLDYDWPMLSREALRNQPSGGDRDYSGQR